MNHRWQIKSMVYVHLFCFCLLFSWLMQPMAGTWEWIDREGFLQLNGSLAIRPDWQKFWALTCWERADFFEAFILGVVSLSFVLLHDPKKINQRLACFATWFVFALLIRYAAKFIVGTLFDFHRASPSCVISPAVSLAPLFPQWQIRDTSLESFPSDHCLILWSWTAFMWRYTTRYYGLAALLISLFFATPRLVSGAHWLTDEWVGSLIFVAVSFAWLVCTPLHAKLTSKLAPLLVPLTNHYLMVFFKNRHTYSKEKS